MERMRYREGKKVRGISPPESLEKEELGIKTNEARIIAPFVPYRIYLPIQSGALSLSFFQLPPPASNSTTKPS